ncbi:MAG: Os1348 family NHLP clan protein [Anaerolineales bacterium]|jgi:hypothetical protein
MEGQSESGEVNVLWLLAGKALVDPRFRAKLLEHPQAAAHMLGLNLTPHQIEHIEELDQAQINAWVNGFEEYTSQDVMAMSAW